MASTEDNSGELAHSNPIQVTDVTNEERAEMLDEFLTLLDVNRTTLRLMPTDEEGKEPIIRGRCHLLGEDGEDTEEAKQYLHTWEEAVEAVREGAPGFVLYAGRESHGTSNLCIIDIDDPELLPLDTFPPTLIVMSGSGGGYHLPYYNSGDVNNTRASGDISGAGEVRAKNWYVVLSGSIHPSGGVYHVVDDSPIATLSLSDLPEGLLPSSSDDRDEINVNAHSVVDVTDSCRNEVGVTLAQCREEDHKLDRLLCESNPTMDSRSEADASCVRKLCDHGFTHQQVMDIMLAYRSYRGRDTIKTDVPRLLSKFGGHGRTWDYPITLDRQRFSDAVPAPHREWISDREGSLSSLTVDGVRRECQTAIKSVFREGDRVLLEALPAMGKSRGVFAAIAETGMPTVVLTSRIELYEQNATWADEENLRYCVLPSFTRDCPTMTGEHGDSWQARVEALYSAGVMPSQIHEHAHRRFGDPLPCEDDGVCPYRQQWRGLDPDEYDVLIGHYRHAYNPRLIRERAVVIDEFPEQAFVTKLSSTERIVSTFAARQPDLPFDDYTDLLECRGDPERRATALNWFEQNGYQPDSMAVLVDHADTEHAFAPLVVRALIEPENLGNGWERSLLELDNSEIVVVRSRNEGNVSILQRPNLSDAHAIVCLDGTPTAELWRLVVEPTLEHRPVLKERRAEFLTEILGIRIIQTTDAAKHYSGGMYVKPDQDASLFAWIAAHEGVAPAVISTRRAIKKYETEGVCSLVGATNYYGNVKGTNEFADERIGVVCGSQHYGDQYLECWGALAGKAISRGEGKGMDLTYGEYGDAVLKHMRENEVLQAAMRFGRDAEGATVYVHTGALPNWVPVAHHGSVKTWSEGQRAVINVLRESKKNEWRVNEMSECVSYSEQAIRGVFAKLYQHSLLERQRDGAGWRYYNPYWERLNEYGVVYFEGRKRGV